MFLFKLKKQNLWLYAVIVLIVYFIYLFYQTSVDYRALLKEEKEYTAKIEYENEKSEALAEVEKKAESKENMEDLARNNLNYLKENEILFIDGEKAE